MRQLDPIQTEQLREIGLLLRQQREEKGLRLEEIKEKTYIPVRMLQALEDGHVEQLPELVFIQGFIKRYGNLLGLDGAALAQKISISPPVYSGPAQLSLDDSQLRFEYKAAYTPYIIALVLIIVAGFAFPWIQASLSSLIAAQKRQPSATNSPAISSPSTSPAPSSPTPVVTEGVEVQITLTDDSWLKVVADNKTEYEGILSKGTQKTWKARKQLTIESGNAGAVMASFNAGESKLMGQPGEVKRVTYKLGEAQ